MMLRAVLKEELSAAKERLSKESQVVKFWSRVRDKMHNEEKNDWSRMRVVVEIMLKATGKTKSNFIGSKLMN